MGFFITEPNTGDYLITASKPTMRGPTEEVITDIRKTNRSHSNLRLRVDFGQVDRVICWEDLMNLGGRPVGSKSIRRQPAEKLQETVQNR